MNERDFSTSGARRECVIILPFCRQRDDYEVLCCGAPRSAPCRAARASGQAQLRPRARSLVRWTTCCLQERRSVRRAELAVRRLHLTRARYHGRAARRRLGGLNGRVDQTGAERTGIPGAGAHGRADRAGLLQNNLPAGSRTTRRLSGGGAGGAAATPRRRGRSWAASAGCSAAAKTTRAVVSRRDVEAARSERRGAGGARRRGPVLLGLAMAVAGAYILTSRVTVSAATDVRATTAFGSHSPLVSASALFFNGRSKAGWCCCSSALS